VLNAHCPNVSKLIRLVKRLVEVVGPMMIMNEDHEPLLDRAHLKFKGTLRRLDESLVKVINAVRASLLRVLVLVPWASLDGKAVGMLLDAKDRDWPDKALKLPKLLNLVSFVLDLVPVHEVGMRRARLAHERKTAIAIVMVMTTLRPHDERYLDDRD
jgi:hypothetical protein